MVLKPENLRINILPTTTAITEYKGESMLYDSNMLNLKYEKSDKNILYIGKAGGDNRLRGRIRQLVKYGYCEADNHRGGRAVWQIENNRGLKIGYFTCNSLESKERELLEIYNRNYDVLPLANWQIG